LDESSKVDAPASSAKNFPSTDHILIVDDEASSAISVDFFLNPMVTSLKHAIVPKSLGAAFPEKFDFGAYRPSMPTWTG